jgi:hypothetical protein
MFTDNPASRAWGSGSKRTESAFQIPNGQALLAEDECMSLCVQD